MTMSCTETQDTKGAHFYAIEERNGQLIPYNAACNYSASANNGNLYRYNNFASVISYRTDRTGGLICAYKIG